MTTDTRSPDQIERDLERRREHVGSTMEELQHRFSPGQLVDQAMGYVQAGGGDFGSNFARTVRENPVPVTLIGAGLAWLMATSLGNGSARGPAPERYVREDEEEDDWLAGHYQDSRAGDLYGPDEKMEAGELYAQGHDHAEIAARDASLAQRLDEVRANISQRSDESSQAFRERLDQARGAALDMQRRADESAADFRYRVDQRISELGDRIASRRQRAGARMQALRTEASARTRRGAGYASDSARAMRDEAVRRGRGASRAAGDLVRDEPLLIGLMGCAIGAGLAALLPVSRREDEMIGPQRDRLRVEGQRAADEAMTRAERVTEQTIEAADAQARREGLTPDETHERGRDLAGRASRVAETTVDAAREAGRREAGQSDQRDTSGPGRA